MLVLIDNYDSFTYNLAQAFAGLGVEPRVLRNDQVSLQELEAMKPSRLVLSPGPGRPAGAGITLAALKNFAGRIPVLGVCLGHQALAEAFGAKVVAAGRLMHGKVSPILHDGRGLFEGLENPFDATRYHSLAVERQSLPQDLEVTAWTEEGEIMGLRHRSLPACEGVQFHPESILTLKGRELLGNFLKAKS